LSAAECNYGDPCTSDECSANVCVHAQLGEPSYLHVVNTAKSWKKLKLGYSSTSLFTPKQNVIAGGNTMMCVTLRGNSATDWSRIQIRPQGSISSPVSLGGYGLGTSFTEICIPLAAFGPGVDFTQLTLIEIPYSNGAGPFEIDIQRIEFRGGVTPFLWFGDPKTDNKHDGNTASSLAVTLVPGTPCGANKMSQPPGHISPEKNISLKAYPNPFSEEVNIEFMLVNTEKVRLEIISLDGRQVSLLFEGEAKAGELQTHQFRSGVLADGMYFCRLLTESGEMRNNKLLLAR
ncbi:MAG TPA: T9SS type A sorting domain-containing protein, partial [Chitinophagales bacterium]|nr:T9SS type A sorting domain-containing protein [Chitinophagales bacterium]